MTTIPKATERVIDATRSATEAIIQTSTQSQERRWQTAVQLANTAAENWQEQQQIWINVGDEAVTRLQNFNRSMMRALFKESEATQQEARRINEALMASGRMMAEAAQELALAWTKMSLSAAALPIGTYVSYAKRVEEMSQQPAEANA